MIPTTKKGLICKIYARTYFDEPITEALGEVVTCKRKSQDGKSVGRKSTPATGQTTFIGCEVEKGGQCGWKRGTREEDMGSEGEPKARTR